MSPAPAAQTVTVSTATGPRQVPAVLRFADPLPGLPGRTEYALDALDDEGLLFALRSAPDAAAPRVRLFVVSPGLFFPDYAPSIPTDALDGVRGRPSAGPAADPVLLSVVHPGEADGEHPTANLLAPLVVNPSNGRAVQTVLDEDLPLRAPLG